MTIKDKNEILKDCLNGSTREIELWPFPNSKRRAVILHVGGPQCSKPGLVIAYDSEMGEWLIFQEQDSDETGCLKHYDHILSV